MNGSISAVTNGSNPDLVIDINGYYASSTGFTLAQGTASAPSLSFSGDAGTGIFSSGMGSLSLTTGGAAALTVDSTADVELAGSVRKSGTLFLHNLGPSSLGVGLGALAVNTGQSNSASGSYALANNTAGAYNTATGASALSANTTGNWNTASGALALNLNTTGIENTAIGYSALRTNTSGSANTASGVEVLNNNTTGMQNTAYGVSVLHENTTWMENTASGALALLENTTGNSNTATGYGALQNNSMGSNNTAYGTLALFSSTGSNNIALGYSAGSNFGGNGGNSNNIDIGNNGLAGDNGTIRIGTSGTHTSFFVAGVQGVAPGQPNPVAVLIDSNGQFGTMNSSRRYKQDIQNMADASSGLLKLRPVTFRYRQPYADGSKPVDYGLIAEEVAVVYPELVVRNKDGQVETVQYHKLTPMLLNELQKEHAELEQERETVRLVQDQVAALQKALDALASKVQLTSGLDK
ncbi:MAG: tail fiber domain-containing protein [Terriglobales bacterium]